MNKEMKQDTVSARKIHKLLGEYFKDLGEHLPHDNGIALKFVHVISYGAFR